jgi:hypothetical protein
MSQNDHDHLLAAAAYLELLDQLLSDADADDQSVIAASAVELGSALDRVLSVSGELRRGVISDGELGAVGTLRDRLQSVADTTSASPTELAALRARLTQAAVEFEADVHDLIADIEDENE